MSRVSLSILLATTVFLLVRPAVVTRGSDRDPAENAALQYWPALVYIPEDPRGSQWEIARYRPLAASLEDIEFLLEKSGISLPVGYALTGLRRGAEKPYCDWGLPLSTDGPGTLLHHLQRSSTASGLLVMSARRDYSRENTSAAIRDLFVAWTFWRHLAHDRTLVSWRGCHATINNEIVPLAASWITALDDRSLNELEERLNDLPELPALSEMIDHEADMYLGWMRNVEEQEGLPALGEMVAHKFGRNSERVQKRIREIVSSPQNFTTFLQTADSIYKEAARIAAHPDSDVSAEIAAFHKRVSKKPLIKALLGRIGASGQSFREFIQMENKAQVRIAMFRAACALQRGSDRSFKSIKDPLTGEPFQRIETNGGFQLVASISTNGDLYTIQFGAGAIPEPEQESQLLIYDRELDVPRAIVEAGKIARRDQKRILLQWGFNGCIPCYRLHSLFEDNARLSKVIRDAYIFIPVSTTVAANRRFARRHGIKISGVPIVTILNAKGEILIHAKVSNSFYRHDELDTDLLFDFLRKWSIRPVEAAHLNN